MRVWEVWQQGPLRVPLCVPLVAPKPAPPPFARYTQESGNSVNLVVNLYLLGVVSTIVYEDFTGVRGRLGDRVGRGV